MHVGSGLHDGASCLNRCICKQDKASDLLLNLPGICLPLSTIFSLRHMDTSFRTRNMIDPILVDCLLIIAMRAALSVKNTIE